MAYIPITKLKERTGSYIPISQAKESIPSPFVDFGFSSFGTQTSTLPVTTPEIIAQQKVITGLPREIGQSISRSGATFFGSEALAPVVDPILKRIGLLERKSPFFSAFTESLGNRLFGDVASDEVVGLLGETRGEEIRPLGERIISFEKKLDEKKKEYDELLKTPGLSRGEKMLLETLSAVIEKNKSSLSTIFVGSIVGMDLTPFGGGEKGIQRAVIGIKTLDDALRFGYKAGIKDDVIHFFEKELILAGTTKEADNVLNAIVKMQSTTKSMTQGVTRAYRPIAEGIDPLAQDISKAKASGQSFDDYRASLLSERISPSKRIVEPSLPKSGLETKVSPSLTRTLELVGASKSTRYIAPSHLYSLDDPFIYSDYSKVSRLMQVNQSAFADDVARATGLNSDVRIKSKPSFEGKVERYRIVGKNPDTIADNLAGRIVVEESEIAKQLSNIQKNFDVVEVRDFFKTPTEFGYKGISAKVKLPNGQLAELQIHTPESLVSASRMHKLYEKWRNLDVEKLTLKQLKEMATDIAESQKLSTRSQLKAEWDGVKLTSKGRLVTQAQKPPFQYKQLDDLAEQIKQQDITEQKFEQIQTELSIAEEGIEDMPGKQLVRFVSRKEGEFLDFKNPNLAKTEIQRKAIIERNEKIMRASEKAFEGTPLSRKYDDPDEIRQAIDYYTQARDRFREINETATSMRKDISAVRKGERLMLLAKGDRRMAYRAVRDAFNLSESDMAKLRQGRDIMAMEKNEFDEFIGNAERMAEQLQKTREARIQLEGTTREKELRKWENIQEAINFPPISKMTPEQLNQLDEILSQYKTGDEFLTVRQLQTIGRTELTGMRTTREVIDYLARKYGLKAGELPPIKPHSWMYDTQLAREHPLYDLLVNRYNESYLKANERIIQLEREVDDLIKQARKTRLQGIGGKIAPTDKRIVEWIESSTEQRALIEKEMTGAELNAAQKMDDYFKEYYDYLVNRSIDKKFSSRFEDKYFPHVRRGFLEAWKEDGFLKSVKEQFDQFKQEERLMTILDEKTGDVLPYEKWIGFSQFRTGGLVPTQNASRAFKSYITALEKARQWDEFIPEIMTYVHSLSPRNMTERGLELDDSLKRFVKSWINAKKGRIEKQIVKPGGKVDWALRMGVALTRIRDLGLNIPVGIANIFGEQAGNLTMLGAKNYSIGVSRLLTSKGRAITKQYENFVGRTLWEKLTEASNTAGDQFLGTIFGLFSSASRRGNQIFLLGNMTNTEFKAGEISLARLAELRKGMGKYRVVVGSESIFGKSVEGAIGGQYKRWAIPILVSTKDNAIKLVQILRTRGVKEALSSKEGSELFYSVILGSAVGLGTMGYYNELKDEKNRNFVEELLYKSIRDSLSLIGALDPKFIGSFAAPRLASFIVDLTESIDQLLFLEKTKEGELKGVS